MHSKGIIHGNLKGVWFWTLTSALPSDSLSTKANVVIDQGGHPRLTDFGLLTIILDHTTYFTGGSAPADGPIRWMSPELISESRPTKKSDCYGLGMVIYEVLAGKPPFARLSDYIVAERVKKGEHPERPRGAEGAWFTDDLWVMLRQCWKPDANNRPSIEDVRECLEHVSSTWKPPPRR